MLFIGLRDYEHFKELFSKRETSNGTMVRQNRILLSYYKNAIKNHEVFTEAKKVVNMTTLYNKVYNRLKFPKEGATMEHDIYLRDIGILYSNTMKTDDLYGICEDGDTTAIRYINKENGRVFKMKAGKFFRKIFMETEYGRKLDESTMLYMLECLTREWQTITSAQLADLELVVDDDFGAIYSCDFLEGDFHSCMTGEDLHSFYEYAVNASAAYLQKDGMIYARCVIFNKVTDEKTGEVFRLAERQYSSEGDELLKHILVDKLIKGGYIDGYKKVGADCHNSRAFIGVNGEDLSNREFSIRCDLDYDDYLSYQDSFKWYDIEKHKAYNTSSYHYTHKLDTTNGRIEGEWDEYHECYCECTTPVYVWRRRWDGAGYYWRDMQCNEVVLDDFVYIDRYSEYYEEAHCVYSNYLCEYIPENEAVYCSEEDDYQWNDEVIYCEESGSYFTNEDAMNEWLEENYEEEEKEELEEVA